MISPVQAPVFPHIPETISRFAAEKLLEQCGQTDVLDLRFSKNRSSGYDLHHPKQYVQGYSGWLTIDPVARSILLTVIEPQMAHLYDGHEDLNVVKRSMDFFYGYDAGLNVTYLGQEASVVKRVWRARKESIECYRKGNQIHREVDQAYPNHIAKAPREHQPIVRLHAKAILYETVQLYYASDFEKMEDLSLLDALPVLVDVAEAIAFMHEKNILHLDVKGKNVLLEKVSEGRMHGRLTDFGLAYRYDDAFEVMGRYRYWDSLGGTWSLSIF